MLIGESLGSLSVVVWAYFNKGALIACKLQVEFGLWSDLACQTIKWNGNQFHKNGTWRNSSDENINGWIIKWILFQCPETGSVLPSRKEEPLSHVQSFLAWQTTGKLDLLYSQNMDLVLILDILSFRLGSIAEKT